MIHWFQRRWCRRFGHDWFPNLPQAEFVPIEEVCFRCGAKMTIYPYGTCLCGHIYTSHTNQGQCTECPCPAWQ